MSLEDLIADRVASLVEAKLAALAPAPASAALLDRQGIAAVLACSVDVIDRLRREGLPTIMVGDSPRFELAAVLDWLKARPTSAIARSRKRPA